MAPLVSLPIREMQHLPDCKKRWADIEDTGTPSPWTEYPLPDFKTMWPETPTPLDAICDPTQHIKNPVLMELAENIPPANGTLVDNLEWAHMALAQTSPALTQSDMPLSACTMPLHSIEAPYPAFAQTSAALSEVLVSCTAGPIEGSFVVLAQTCPARSEIAVVPCTAGPVGVTLQQDFQSYEVNGTSTHGSYAMGVQWPSFAQTTQQSDSWVNAGDTMQVIQPESPASVMQPQSEMEQLHNSGQCRPCAWFWRSSGCRNGGECSYCHLCPDGELKSRKKTKIAAMRMGALTPLRERSQSTNGWGLKLDSLIQDEP